MADLFWGVLLLVPNNDFSVWPNWALGIRFRDVSESERDDAPCTYSFFLGVALVIEDELLSRLALLVVDGCRCLLFLKMGLIGCAWLNVDILVWAEGGFVRSGLWVETLLVWFQLSERNTHTPLVLDLFQKKEKEKKKKKGFRVFSTCKRRRPPPSCAPAKKNKWAFKHHPTGHQHHHFWCDRGTEIQIYYYWPSSSFLAEWWQKKKKKKKKDYQLDSCIDVDPWMNIQTATYQWIYKRWTTTPNSYSNTLKTTRESFFLSLTTYISLPIQG